MAQPHRSPIDGFPPDTDRSAGKIPAARRGCATVTGLLNAGAAVGAVGPSRTTMSTEVKTNSVSSRIAWNKGRLVGQKRPLRPKEVWAIRVRLQMKHRKRDLALFNLAIDSKLRGCDLVSLRVDDIAAGGRVRDRATIIQHKTCRPVQFEIMEQTRASVQEWLDARPADRGPTERPAICTRSRCFSKWLHSAHEQPAEARISYRFHPRFGEVVQIRRRLESGGVEFVVVLQPDGSFACLPAWMTEPAASRFTISDQPHFPLHILRSMRMEVDALLGFLLPESKPEGAQNGAQIRTSPTSPTKPVRRGDAAREPMPGSQGRTRGPRGSSAPRDRGDAGPT